MSNSNNTPKSKKSLHDIYKSAASNLGMMSDIDWERPDTEDEEEDKGELLAYQEWCGAYAGIVELYQLGDRYIVHAEDGQHEYTDAQEALRGSGIAIETDATVSIWIDSALAQRQGGTG
jgi:hypothetical protein